MRDSNILNDYQKQIDEKIINKLDYELKIQIDIC